MYWGPSWEGGHMSAATDTRSTVWHFAEGSTKNAFFDNYFLVFNPSKDTSANVTIQFYGTSGGILATQTFTVPPQARHTVAANAVPEIGNSDFSTTITSSIPVVAERSMYWGNGWTGGTNSFGATQTSPTWLFAEGAAARSFDTYYTILNPTSAGVTVDVTYMGPSGPFATRSYTAPPNSRATIWLTREVGLVGAVGAEFHARDNAGIVVERSIYWGGSGWVEGTNALGVTAPAATWHLPEGTTLGSFETYVLVSNPNDQPVIVQVTTILDAGAIIPTNFNIAAHGRLTLLMNDTALFPSLGKRSFATRVDCMTQGLKVVAEHALYWNWTATDYWRGGSASAGIPR